MVYPGASLRVSRRRGPACPLSSGQCTVRPIPPESRPSTPPHEAIVQMAIIVHVATTAPDFERFRELVTDYEESLDSDLRHADFASDLAALRERYSSPNAAFVAAVDATPAGCVALSEFDGATGLVKKLYVRPAYRNMGVARALMTTLVDQARRRRYEYLVLDTERERLHAAYALYGQLGFEECEPYGTVDYALPTFMRLRV